MLVQDPRNPSIMGNVTIQDLFSSPAGSSDYHRGYFSLFKPVKYRTPFDPMKFR